MEKKRKTSDKGANEEEEDGEKERKHSKGNEAEAKGSEQADDDDDDEDDDDDDEDSGPLQLTKVSSCPDSVIIIRKLPELNPEEKNEDLKGNENIITNRLKVDPCSCGGPSLLSAFQVSSRKVTTGSEEGEESPGEEEEDDGDDDEDDDEGKKDDKKDNGDQRDKSEKNPNDSEEKPETEQTKEEEEEEPAEPNQGDTPTPYRQDITFLCVVQSVCPPNVRPSTCPNSLCYHIGCSIFSSTPKPVIGLF